MKLPFNKILIDDANRTAKSITHKHILSILNTIIKESPTVDSYRILDAGCGDCELLSYLETFLPKFHPELNFEVYGFDVSDSKVQFNDFFDKALRMLSKRHNHINWKKRLTKISEIDPWPFDDGCFDMVVSNQVVEHIHDHDFFFSQNWRVLKEKGFSLHLFPVKNYLIEGHLHLPFVHRVSQWPLLYWTIRTLSLLRFGRWKAMKNHCSLDEFSKSYADFLTYYCNYTTIKDLLNWGKKSEFRTGFNFTGKFYSEKLKDLFHIQHPFIYKKNNPHYFSIHFYKYLQCITLFLEKKDEFINYIGEYSGE